MSQGNCLLITYDSISICCICLFFGIVFDRKISDWLRWKEENCIHEGRKTWIWWSIEDRNSFTFFPSNINFNWQQIYDGKGKIELFLKILTSPIQKLPLKSWNAWFWASIIKHYCSSLLLFRSKRICVLHSPLNFGESCFKMMC